MPLRLSIRAIHASTVQLLCLTLLLGLLAAPGWAQVPTLKVISDDVVTNAAQRRAQGQRASPPLTDKDNGFAWPDTPLGVVRYPGNYVFFASDGARHRQQSQKCGSATVTFGNLGNPLGSPVPMNNFIHPNPALNPAYRSYNYIGGGPVLKVPAGLPGAGNLLMTYHAERDTTGPGGFYSLLGVALSRDAGKTWTDLGEIIRVHQPYQRNLEGFEIGDPPLVLDPGGSFIMVHFPDWMSNGTPRRRDSGTHLSVARVGAHAFLQAAQRGTRLPPFQKYFQNSWSQPGLGGMASDILPSTPFAGSPQVAYSTSLRQFIAILDDTSHISYSTSPDCLTWSPARLIKSAVSALYATPVGTGEDPSKLGRRFYVYYVQNPKGWDSASLHRLTVSE